MDKDKLHPDCIALVDYSRKSIKLLKGGYGEKVTCIDQQYSYNLVSKKYEPVGKPIVHSYIITPTQLKKQSQWAEEMNRFQSEVKDWVDNAVNPKHDYPLRSCVNDEDVNSRIVSKKVDSIEAMV